MVYCVQQRPGNITRKSGKFAADQRGEAEKGAERIMAGKSQKRGKKKSKSKKYKLKTHKATAKRFKTTGSGKIMRTKGRQGHFRRRKSKRSKRQFATMTAVSAAGHRKTIRRLAPYLSKYKTKGH